MPNLVGTFPLFTNLVPNATITTNTNSANLTIPYGQSYRFFFSVNTVSGTSPTLIATIATSIDGGTTYQDILTSTTLTTTGQGCTLVFKPYLGSGDIATAQGSSLNSILTINPTAATAANGPIDPAHIKIKYVVGGTSPSFNITTAVGVVPQDMSD